MTFLRPSYRGDWGWNFRVFEAMRAWGKGPDRTAGKQRERDRVRYRKRKTLRVFQIGELYLRIGTFWEERVALAEILDAMCAFRQF